jgi:hypothetical protein
VDDVKPIDFSFFYFYSSGCLVGSSFGKILENHPFQGQKIGRNAIGGRINQPNTFRFNE